MAAIRAEKNDSQKNGVEISRFQEILGDLQEILD